MEHLKPIWKELPLSDWLCFLRILVLVNCPNQGQKTLIYLPQLWQIEEELFSSVRRMPFGMLSPDP